MASATCGSSNIDEMYLKAVRLNQAVWYMWARTKARATHELHPERIP